MGATRHTHTGRHACAEAAVLLRYAHPHFDFADDVLDARRYLHKVLQHRVLLVVDDVMHAGQRLGQGHARLLHVFALHTSADTWVQSELVCVSAGARHARECTCWAEAWAEARLPSPWPCAVWVCVEARAKHAAGVCTSQRECEP